MCEPQFAIALAGALRHGLIATAVQRFQDTDRSNKMARLYDYLWGDHEDPRKPGSPLRLCSWQVNDVKNDLTIEELLELTAARRGMN